MNLVLRQGGFSRMSIIIKINMDRILVAVINFDLNNSIMTKISKDFALIKLINQ